MGRVLCAAFICLTKGKNVKVCENMVDDWKDHFLNPTITAKRVERKSENRANDWETLLALIPSGSLRPRGGHRGQTLPLIGGEWALVCFVVLVCSIVLVCFVELVCSVELLWRRALACFVVLLCFVELVCSVELLWRGL